MKVAVVFIGTSKYLNFLPRWYENCEKFFLTDVEKKYLVFTDGEIPEAPDNAVIYSQEHLDWPFITLYRFKMLNKSFGDLEDCDWLVFLDADMLVVDTVNVSDIIDESKKYIGVHHPCHYLKMTPHDSGTGAFDTTKLSNASFTEGDDISVYFQGCLWGGRIPEVLDLINELDRRIDEDYEKDIIATWHDESHLNKFYSQNREDVFVVHPSFAYPEVFADSCTFDPKIVHLSKDNSKYHV